MAANKQKIKFWHIGVLFGLAILGVQNATAQEGDWVQDRSRPAFESIKKVGASIVTTPIEYNLPCTDECSDPSDAIDKFFLRGSAYGTRPDTEDSSLMELSRIRFLLHTAYEGDDYARLIPSGAQIGAIISTHAGFNCFIGGEEAGCRQDTPEIVPDIGSLVRLQVKPSYVETIQPVPIVSTRVRIRSVQMIGNYDGQFLEVELILPQPFRLPNFTDMRIAPFIEGWNTRTYETGVVQVKQPAGSLESYQRDIYAYSLFQGMSSLPQLLLDLFGTDPFNLRNLVTYSGVYEDNTVAALGLNIGYPSLELVIRSGKFYHRFSNARCLFIQITTDLKNWSYMPDPSDPDQRWQIGLSAGDSPDGTFEREFPNPPPRAYFRLVESDESNVDSCLVYP